MERGKFVVIEGGDGAGKDTHIALLRKDLGEEGIRYTRDPGGTLLGNQLREIVQHGESVGEQTEMLLFLASRAQLIHEVIGPSLEQGVHVICNRFDYSTTAYQLYGRNKLEWKGFLQTARTFINSEITPDLVVFLDVSPDVALGRLVLRGKKMSRFEREKIEFHERVRKGYRESMKEFANVHVVDASRPIAAVYTDVSALVRSVLPRS